MNPSRLFALSLCLIAFIVRAEPGTVETTPKLENLNKQIMANAEDSQAYSNRDYTLALLGRKEEARADIKKSVALKDTGPMHNRACYGSFAGQIVSNRTP